ncbi:MAG: hypothetical protein ACERKT_09380 [Acidobacteriota bacterium]
MSTFISAPKRRVRGYQVCDKWLRDRSAKKGKPARPLTAEDLAQYHCIVIALRETVRIMREIDDAVDAHGGWPVSFQADVDAQT